MLEFQSFNSITCLCLKKEFKKKLRGLQVFYKVVPMVLMGFPFFLLKSANSQHGCRYPGTCLSPQKRPLLPCIIVQTENQLPQSHIIHHINTKPSFAFVSCRFLLISVCKDGVFSYQRCITLRSAACQSPDIHTEERKSLQQDTLQTLLSHP